MLARVGKFERRGTYVLHLDRATNRGEAAVVTNLGQEGGCYQIVLVATVW